MLKSLPILARMRGICLLISLGAYGIRLAAAQTVGDDVSAGATSQVLRVACRVNGTRAQWQTHEALTVDRIAGFSPDREYETDAYGGWRTDVGEKATGLFRVAKIGSRWWLIDPLGNPFVARGVACLSPGRSARQREVLKSRFGAVDDWAREELKFLRDAGFNSLGAWSAVDTLRKCPNRLPYTVIVSPLAAYNRRLRKSGDEAAGFSEAYRTGCPYDFPFVFDSEFAAVAEKEIAVVARYADDPMLIGYFLGNEIPWLDTALTCALTKMPEGHRNRRIAQAWLDREKGRRGCTAADVTPDDGRRFAAHCHETYLRKVVGILRRYDANHLVLGTRYCRWRHELANEHLLRTAGKYVDVVSVNHYGRWQPDPKALSFLERAARRPLLVSEFYVKGEDSGLPNRTGAGWLVRTQEDRGIFYENFVNVLLGSGVCVGWQWFKYQDNDQTDERADASNRDSNKGLVTWDYRRYEPLVRHARNINAQVYRLIRFYDRKAPRD